MLGLPQEHNLDWFPRMRAMSLVSSDAEGEQNEIRNLQEKLESTMRLVSNLSGQLTELKEQVIRHSFSLQCIVLNILLQMVIVLFCFYWAFGILLTNHIYNIKPPSCIIKQLYSTNYLASCFGYTITRVHLVKTKLLIYCFYSIAY